MIEPISRSVQTPVRRPLNRRVTELILSSTHRIRRSGSFSEDLGANVGNHPEDDVQPMEAVASDVPQSQIEASTSSASEQSVLPEVRVVDTEVAHPMDVDDGVEAEAETAEANRENIKPRRGRPRKSELATGNSEGVSPR